MTTAPGLDWADDEYTLLTDEGYEAVRAAYAELDELARREHFDSGRHPRVPHGPHGGEFTARPHGTPGSQIGAHEGLMPRPPTGASPLAGQIGQTVATSVSAPKGRRTPAQEAREIGATQATYAMLAPVGSHEQRFSEPDSLTTHTRPDGTFDPGRQRLHRQIVREALDSIHPSGAVPQALFFGGGAASPQSTLGGHVGVTVDPDWVKERIPEYLARKRSGDQSAAAWAHEESSAVAKQIQAAAAERGLDFTLDGVGNGTYDKMQAKLDAARAKGYKITGKYVTADTDEAWRRAQARAKETGRLVPEPVLRAQHAAVSETFAKLIANDSFDAAELWDTNGAKPILVGRKEEGGTWQVKDQTAWDRFLAKAA